MFRQKNPVKINAAIGGLESMIPDFKWIVEPVVVASGVADQPLTDEETLRGASKRVENAFKAYPDANLLISIEGGVATINQQLAAFGWVVIKSTNLSGKARSGTFFLPQTAKELLGKGMELGTTDDMVFGHTNSKQQGGDVGIITGNVVDRKQLYELAVVLALIPFKNKELYYK